MSAAKDKDGRWYCKFRYKDWQGKTVQKKKIGFATKKAAQEWEQEFKKKMQGSGDMQFHSLYELFEEDLKHHAKEATFINYTRVARNHILPVFGDAEISAITPIMIRKWYQGLKNSEATNSLCVSILNMVFNFGVKFCGVKKNPTHGIITTKRPHKEMLFYTLDEFNQFISTVTNPRFHCIFNLLFYSGMRKGEMLAITLSDFDFTNNTVRISKSYSPETLKITSPKTETSIRTITLPQTICDEVQQFAVTLYDYQPEDRLFDITSPTVNRAFRDYAAKAGVKRIRIHDLRHSHASLLIHLGYPILVVSKRLGHANPSITMNVYSHLYEEVHTEVADRLESIIQENGTKMVH